MVIFFRYLIFTFFIISVSPVALLGQEATYQKVVAKEGDGIYTLLRENGLNPSTHLPIFLELNKENLGENNKLYKGQSYLLPNLQDSISIIKNTTEEDNEPSPSTIPIATKRESVAAVIEDKTMVINVPYLGKNHERLEI